MPKLSFTLALLLVTVLPIFLLFFSPLIPARASLESTTGTVTVLHVALRDAARWCLLPSFFLQAPLPPPPHILRYRPVFPLFWYSLQSPNGYHEQACVHSHRVPLQGEACTSVRFLPSTGKAALWFRERGVAVVETWIEVQRMGCGLWGWGVGRGAVWVGAGFHQLGIGAQGSLHVVSVSPTRVLPQSYPYNPPFLPGGLSRPG
jgi:hypothetical protein